MPSIVLVTLDPVTIILFELAAPPSSLTTQVCPSRAAAAAGKVKRLRNSSRARLAVCDAQGKLLGGWHEASAEIIMEPADVARALQILRAKYGWQMVLTDFFSRLTGRFKQRIYIRVRLHGEDEASSVEDGR